MQVVRGSIVVGSAAQLDDIEVPPASLRLPRAWPPRLDRSDSMSVDDQTRPMANIDASSGTV